LQIQIPIFRLSRHRNFKKNPTKISGIENRIGIPLLMGVPEIGTKIWDSQPRWGTDNNELRAAAEEIAVEMPTSMVTVTATTSMMARMTTASSVTVVEGVFLPAVAMVMLVAVLGCWLPGAYILT
jgi:hypothetical protein